MSTKKRERLTPLPPTNPQETPPQPRAVEEHPNLLGRITSRLRRELPPQGYIMPPDKEYHLGGHLTGPKDPNHAAHRGKIPREYPPARRNILPSVEDNQATVTTPDELPRRGYLINNRRIYLLGGQLNGKLDPNELQPKEPRPKRNKQ